MHILLIPPSYPTRENRARGIFYRDQAQALCRAGHKVGVLVAPQIRPKRDLLKMRRLSDFQARSEIFDDDGVITSQTALWSWLPPQLHRAYTNVMVKSVLSMYADYAGKFGAPDLLHAHNCIYGGYLGASLKERTGLPLMLTEHSSAFISNGMLERQIPYARKALRSSDGICAVSNALAQAVGRFEPTCNASVLGNIVDTDYFSLPQQAPPRQPFTFASIGFLRKIKNFELLIRAFGRAFHSQTILLRIAGDGEERESLERLVKDLGLQSQVHLLGRLDRNGIRELIQMSHAVVSSSWVETFGVTLIEALSCGKPVVATRSGGPEDFISDQNGILVPVGDEIALAEAMKRMVEDWHTYDPHAIRSQCVERFSEKAIVRQLEGLYEALVKR